MQNYCGKNCEICTYKEELVCSGCQSGPGRVISGDCKLARCCRDKGHETCETCGHKRNCGIWLDKESIPKQRLERRNEEQEQQEVLECRAPFLAKWLTVLFWLVVPNFISSLLTGEKIVATVPELERIGELIQMVSSVAHAAILLWMAKEHKVYRLAGLLGLGTVVVEVIYFELKLSNLGLGLLFILLELALVLASANYEYKAHAEMILPVDGNLSEQWDMIWNWQLYATIAFAVSLFFMVLIPWLGLLLALASVIGLAVASVKRLICLRNTARAFARISN